MPVPATIQETIAHLEQSTASLVEGGGDGNDERDNNAPARTWTIGSKRPLRAVWDASASAEDVLKDNPERALGRLNQPQQQQHLSKDESFKSSLEYFQQLKEQHEKEHAEMKQRHETRVEKLATLRAVYLYGLHQVSNLQDLRKAPDAILPGNFPPTKKTRAAEETSSLQKTDNFQSAA